MLLGADLSLQNHTASTTIKILCTISSHIILEKCQREYPACELSRQPAPKGYGKNDKIISMKRYNVTDPVNRIFAL